MDKYSFKKLDEDDILEILIEYFQEGEYVDFTHAKACLFGEPGKDLRFIAIFSDDEEKTNQYDLKNLDNEIDYNGDHSFLKNHPGFLISKPTQDTQD